MPITLGAHALQRRQQSLSMLLPLRIFGHLHTGKTLRYRMFGISGQLEHLPLVDSDLQRAGVRAIEWADGGENLQSRGHCTLAGSLAAQLFGLSTRIGNLGF